MNKWTNLWTRWMVYALVLATAVVVDSYYPQWWVGIPLALYILGMVSWAQSATTEARERV